ncbi:MAG: thioesterase family protein [Gammaproteobacteria bacterium]|nr:thioesterase family protein [Gammaproteobacteria bacterium]
MTEVRESQSRKHIVTMIHGNLQDLCDLLTVTRTAAGMFLGGQPLEDRYRVYGGQFLGQGLLAACWDQPYPAHSLHAIFLRPGTPDTPIEYRVQNPDPTLTPTSLRTVSARQNGRELFLMDVVLADFVPADPQAAMKLAGPDKAIPREEGIRHLATNTQASWANADSPFDNRFVENIWRDDYNQPGHHVWFRTRGSQPTSATAGLTAQQMRQAVLAYYVDDTIMDNALFPGGWLTSWDTLETASLDHCMWFHQDYHYDEWLLHDQDSPVAAHGRGLTRATVYTEDWRPVASSYQEILMRLSAAQP